MLLFWSITDIGGNEVVQQQLLKFQAKEVANDIELVNDYQNEGYAEISLDANYSFGVTGAGVNSPGPYSLTLGLAGNKQTVDLNVEVETQNQPGNGMANFSTQVLCIYRDYDSGDLTRYQFLASGVPATPDPQNTYLAEIHDPEDSTPNDGSVENDDTYVQFYPGRCLS